MAEEIKQLAEDQMRDARSLFLIQQGVEENLFLGVIGVTKAKQVWEILREEFQWSAKVIVVKL